jgi:hypothetical protein
MKLDLGQRDYELAEAITTLLIAVSRYGNDDGEPRPTPARLATLTEVTALVADGVAERVGNINGKDASKQFRKRLAAEGE